MVDRIYHYTSSWRWQKIKESGFLYPKSYPLDGPFVPDKFDQLIKDNKYIVGIPLEFLHAWDHYELLDKVKSWAAYRDFGGYARLSDYVVIDVPILNSEGAFLREHKYPSNKYRRILYNRINLNIQSERELWEKYYNSTIPFSEYHGQFEVPEVWLPQRIPIDLIQIIGG